MAGLGRWIDDFIGFPFRRIYEGDEILKLHLPFIIMDLVTLMAIPVVFVLGKLRRSLKTLQAGSVFRGV